MAKYLWMGMAIGATSTATLTALSIITPSPMQQGGVAIVALFISLSCWALEQRGRNG